MPALLLITFILGATVGYLFWAHKTSCCSPATKAKRKG